MTVWTHVDPLAAFAVGKAITFEYGRLWYNNPIAIAEGADGAPRISRRAIHPGGAAIDGDFGDGSTAPSLAGFHEYGSLVLTTPKTFPFISHIRVNGNVSIASTLSIAPTTLADQSLAQWFNAHIGANGQANGSLAEPGTGGGANIGSGGQGDGNNLNEGGGAGRPISGLKRIWLTRTPILGGRGGITNGPNVYGRGGGSLILIVAGDLDLTGGTLDASGGDGPGDSGRAAGGGGGGSLIVICTGTLTGGTFCARGGNGRNGSGINGGGGGGGYVALVAADFIGTQTIDVAGGFGPDTAQDGGPGATETETLTEAEINGILLR